MRNLHKKSNNIVNNAAKEVTENFELQHNTRIKRIMHAVFKNITETAKYDLHSIVVTALLPVAYLIYAIIMCHYFSMVKFHIVCTLSITVLSVSTLLSKSFYDNFEILLILVLLCFILSAGFAMVQCEIFTLAHDLKQDVVALHQLYG